MRIVSLVDKPGFNIISSFVYHGSLHKDTVDTLEVLNGDGKSVPMFPGEYIILKEKTRDSNIKKLKRWIRLA